MRRTYKQAAIIFLALVTASLRLSAQIDFSGSWAARNYGDALGNRPGPGPTPVDYLGLPINENARERALLYSPSQISMPERMCSLYAPIYVLLGPFGLKLSNETEPRNGTTTAWKIAAWEDMGTITIWMDGRPHPSANAPHEPGGFTTGVWEDDVLTTFTTHMKTGVLRRNGVATTDRATLKLRFFRHDDILTVTGRIDDPLVLTEPLYLTRTFQLSKVPPYPAVGGPCIPGDEGVPVGSVPHYFPGKNPFLFEMTTKYNIPHEAALGGAETMYPDFRKKIRDSYEFPKPCTADCGGPGAFPLR